MVYLSISAGVPCKEVYGCLCFSITFCYVVDDHTLLQVIPAKEHRSQAISDDLTTLVNYGGEWSVEFSRLKTK